MRLRLHHVIVLLGTALGIAGGVFVLDTDPQVFGALFGAGAGLAGGAFVAAITSGEQVVGGGPTGTRTRRGRPNPALRHWEQSVPPATNGAHEREPSDVERDRLN
jgi:hypothetical protein